MLTVRMYPNLREGGWIEMEYKVGIIRVLLYLISGFIRLFTFTGMVHCLISEAQDLISGP